MTNNICIVLNVYKRRHYLIDQINSVLSQTIQPTRIVILNNSQDIFRVKHPQIPLTIIDSTENLGVWSRFTIPLLFRHDFYCVFDDDTLPGARWLENCLSTYNNRRALLGTIGLRFLSRRYHEHIRYGWSNPVEEATTVDLVGHAWFFDYEMAKAFWSVKRLENSPYAGEDIHFSYVLQMEMGLETIVPPHPKEATDLWGATQESSQKRGNDGFATSALPGAYARFQFALDYYLKSGFSLLNEK
jgi:hypothetical protein